MTTAVITLQPKKSATRVVTLQSTLPMYISKASTARILKVNVNCVTRVRIMNGKVIAQYRMNRGNCCTLISFNEYKKDFLTQRLDAHIKHEYEITCYNDLDNLNEYRAVVKYANSSDSHMVEIESNGVYNCDCADFRKQKEFGNGFTKFPICKHLKPVSLAFGFNTFSDMIKSVQSVKKN